MNKERLQELVDNKSTLTYKDICQELDEPYHTNSGNKICQLKKWANEFTLIKNGTRYTFDSILTDDDKEYKQIVSAYNTMLKTCLIMILCENDITSRPILLSELYYGLSLINHNYTYSKRHKNTILNLAMEDKIPVYNNEIFTETDLDKFYDSFDNNAKRHVLKALDDLEKEKLLSYKRYCCIGYAIKRTNRNSKIGRVRLTKQQEDIFLFIQREELEKFPMIYDEDLCCNRYHTIDDINSDKSKCFKYYKNIKQRILEEFDCEYYCYEYDIVLNQKSSVGFIEYNKEILSKLRKDINERVINNRKTNKTFLTFYKWFVDVDSEINIKKMIDSK